MRKSPHGFRRPKFEPMSRASAGPIEVTYRALDPPDATYHDQKSRKCPVCKLGHMAMSRSPSTMVLNETDHCLYCSQKITYVDIDRLRSGDYFGCGRAGTIRDRSLIG